MLPPFFCRHLELNNVATFINFKSFWGAAVTSRPSIVSEDAYSNLVILPEPGGRSTIPNDL